MCEDLVEDYGARLASLMAAAMAQEAGQVAPQAAEPGKSGFVDIGNAFCSETSFCGKEEL